MSWTAKVVQAFNGQPHTVCPNTLTRKSHLICCRCRCCVAVAVVVIVIVIVVLG